MKNAESNMFYIIIAAIVAIVVLVTILLIWSNQSGKGFKSLLGLQNDVSSDCDNDGIANIIDDCPYQSGIPDFNGCTSADDKALPFSERKKLGCPIQSLEK